MSRPAGTTGWLTTGVAAALVVLGVQAAVNGADVELGDVTVHDAHLVFQSGNEAALGLMSMQTTFSPRSARR